jgi:selenocysteine lyase/cysteine desulfurase
MNPIEELTRSMHASLQTYSNVHRGSGHFSRATTRLYEQARDIVLGFLGLKKGRYVVIFCNPRRAAAFKAQLIPGFYQVVSSKEIGLSLGVAALVVKRKAVPRIVRFEAGGGTARLVSRDWVIWDKAPDKFEAGTPAIINVIAFARALQLVKETGISGFQDIPSEKHTVTDILYHDELEKFTGKELLDELRKSLIGRDTLVPTGEGPRPFINLDNGASTPTFIPVFHAAAHSLRLPIHIQKEIATEVRTFCSGFLHAPLADYDLHFTTNTTEGINLVAESLGHENDREYGPVIVNTMLEHNSNDLPWRSAGASLVRLPVDEHGFVDLTELERILREYNEESVHEKTRVKLVAVSGASNVLGIYNDLAEIGRIVHRYGARMLVDAAQMVAHRPVDIEGCEIDYFVFSAHKVYAPFGCGMLIARKGSLLFTPAELSLIRSSGEENTAGIAALGKSLVLLQRAGMDLIQKEEQALTARLLQGMSQIPGVTIFGIRDSSYPEFERKGGVIVFQVKGVFPDKVAKELALRAGIGVRFGCHCSHILIKHLLHVSPRLERFQYYMISLIPAINLPGLTRVSLGIENTEEDIDTLIRVLGEIAGKTRYSSPGVKEKMVEFVLETGRKVYS